MRHKDVEWSLPEGTRNANGGTTHSWDAIRAALLMDIRDELRTLNAVLRCQNFLGIPQTLKKIDTNTRKKRPARRPTR